MSVLMLTVRQPFATYLIHGEKTIENRTRQTMFRGRIGIHSGAAPHASVSPDLRAKIARHEAPEFPTSSVLGTVQIVGCHRAHPGCCDPDTGAEFPDDQIDPRYPPDFQPPPTIWHWEIDNPREFTTPIRHVRGALGFWPADDRTQHLMSISEVIER